MASVENETKVSNQCLVSIYPCRLHDIWFERSTATRISRVSSGGKLGKGRRIIRERDLIHL
jgi:hypothetical protein